MLDSKEESELVHTHQAYEKLKQSYGKARTTDGPEPLECPPSTAAADEEQQVEHKSRRRPSVSQPSVTVGTVEADLLEVADHPLAAA